MEKAGIPYLGVGGRMGEEEEERRETKSRWPSFHPPFPPFGPNMGFPPKVGTCIQ